MWIGDNDPKTELSIESCVHLLLAGERKRNDSFDKTSVVTHQKKQSESERSQGIDRKIETLGKKRERSKMEGD